MIACPAISTGEGFLVETLGQLDCQAQMIGSYGFVALADPASPAALVLTALLTLFVALFGMRMLFGGTVGTGDIVGGVLKIGIVLTLALSWPAFRTLVYDTVLFGPGEIAASIGGEDAMHDPLAQRLQRIDSGIVALTALGTGRQTGQLAVPGEGVGSFQGEALADETGFGWGRTVFLAGTIGALGALRVAAGLLLAIAPLIAGLLLFDASRGIFAGWLRGLVLTGLGSLGITLLLSVEAAAIEPWLAGALERRTLGYATPGTPTELIALTLGFALAAFVLLGLLGRVAFQKAWPMANWLPVPLREALADARTAPSERPAIDSGFAQSRAWAVGEGVRMTMRHETYRSEHEERRVTEALTRGGGDGSYRASGGEPLGSSYRRTARRTSAAGAARDRKP